MVIESSVAVHRGIYRLPTAFALTDGMLRDIERDCGEIFRANMRRNFATEGSHGGPKWEEWTERYKRRREAWQRGAKAENKTRARKGKRAKRVGPMKILQLSGELKRSLTDKTHKNHISRRRLFSKTHGRVQFGSRDKKIEWLGPYEDHNAAIKAIRDAVQHTPAQIDEYREAARKVLVLYFRQIAQALFIGRVV